MFHSIAIVGHARAGKDTVAEHLVCRYGYLRVALADPLKQALRVLNPLVPTATGARRLDDLVETEGWEGAKHASPDIRRLMQTLGTDIVRELFGDDSWVRLAVRTVDAALAEGRRVVITDVRYPNEARAFRERGLRLIRIQRPGFDQGLEHSSEMFYRDIDCYADLANNSTVDALLRRVDDLLAD